MQVIGPEDEMLGDLDRGRGLVYDANGSSVLSLDAAGHAKGATQVWERKVVKGFSFFHSFFSKGLFG